VLSHHPHLFHTDTLTPGLPLQSRGQQPRIEGGGPCTDTHPCNVRRTQSTTDGCAPRLILRNVSLGLRNVSLGLRNVSFGLRNVSVGLRNVSFRMPTHSPSSRARRGGPCCRTSSHRVHTHLLVIYTVRIYEYTLLLSYSSPTPVNYAMHSQCGILKRGMP
jgi:hypothetical protein